MDVTDSLAKIKKAKAATLAAVSMNAEECLGNMVIRSRRIATNLAVAKAELEVLTAHGDNAEASILVRDIEIAYNVSLDDIQSAQDAYQVAISVQRAFERLNKLN
jgi:hypothetical protein